jgi:hypothetical protein
MLLSDSGTTPTTPSDMFAPDATTTLSSKPLRFEESID